MLPSRGLLRLSPSLGLAKATLPKPSTLSTRGLSRQFGTALRSRNGTFTHRAFPARRIGGLLALTATSQQSVFSRRQARNASTQSTISSGAAPAEASSLADFTGTPVSLTGSDLLDIPEQIGFLKTFGLEYGWGPTSLMQTLLESVYVYTGLPWWASIGIVVLGIRLVLVKPTLEATENAQKAQELQKDPRYAAATEEVKRMLFTGNHLAGAQARAKLSLMNKAAGYKPWKNFIQLIQIPLSIGMFRVLSGMAALPVPSLETGGLLWFTDLTVADPYFILPIMTAVVVANTMKIPLPYMAPQQQKLFKTMSLVMLPVISVVSLFLPAGLQFFFLTSSALQLLQTYLSHQAGFRRWAGLKPLPEPVGGSMSWEAPRVVDLQAPRIKGAQTGAAPQSESMYKTVRSSMDVAKDRFNDYADRKSREQAQKMAREYEEKRALEEKEKYVARQQRRMKDNGY